MPRAHRAKRSDLDGQLKLAPSPVHVALLPQPLAFLEQRPCLGGGRRRRSGQWRSLSARSGQWRSGAELGRTHRARMRLRSTCRSSLKAAIDSFFLGPPRCPDPNIPASGEDLSSLLSTCAPRFALSEFAQTRSWSRFDGRPRTAESSWCAMGADARPGHRHNGGACSLCCSSPFSQPHMGADGHCHVGRLVEVPEVPEEQDRRSSAAEGPSAALARAMEGNPDVDAGIGWLGDVFCHRTAQAALTVARETLPNPCCVGVGMELVEVASGRASEPAPLLLVQSLVPRGPAECSAAIAPGDCLVAVDRRRVSSSADARRLILGERGTGVTLSFQRRGHAFEVPLRRERVWAANAFTLADQVLMSAKDPSDYHHRGIPMFCQQGWAEGPPAGDGHWRTSKLENLDSRWEGWTTVEHASARAQRDDRFLDFARTRVHYKRVERVDTAAIAHSTRPLLHTQEGPQLSSAALAAVGVDSRDGFARHVAMMPHDVAT